MGPRLLPILSALKDTLAFFIVTGTCILAATHAYYNLQLREEPIPTYGAFLQVMLRLVLGFFPAVLLYWDMFLFFLGKSQWHGMFVGSNSETAYTHLARLGKMISMFLSSFLQVS